MAEECANCGVKGEPLQDCVECGEAVCGGCLDIEGLCSACEELEEDEDEDDEG